MGHLISRAFRRLTSAAPPNSSTTNTPTSSRTNEPPEQQQQQQQQQRASAVAPQLVQSIQVGQSIDSAEYFALDQDNSSASRQPPASELAPPTAADSPRGEREAAQEAAIKIQAYVRGHLTRKALRQRQESAPAAVGSTGSFKEQEGGARSAPIRTRLESIAELNEQQQQQRAGAVESGGGGGGVASPVPSEAAASIDMSSPLPSFDLNSASIDILDYAANQLPGSMAGVLLAQPDQSSQQQQQPQPQPQPQLQPLLQVQLPQLVEPANENGTSAGVDEAAAAIRIQSAFRGYKTRKHSPYRRRSPADSPAPLAAEANGHSATRPLDQRLELELDDEQPAAERTSRSQQRAQELNERLEAQQQQQQQQQSAEITQEPSDSTCSPAAAVRQDTGGALADDEADETDDNSAIAAASATGHHQRPSVASSAGCGQLVEDQCESVAGLESGRGRLSEGALSAGCNLTPAGSLDAEVEEQEDEAEQRQEEGAAAEEEEDDEGVALSPSLVSELDSDDLERRDPRGASSLSQQPEEDDEEQQQQAAAGSSSSSSSNSSADQEEQQQQQQQPEQQPDEDKENNPQVGGTSESGGVSPQPERASGGQSRGKKQNKANQRRQQQQQRRKK